MLPTGTVTFLFTDIEGSTKLAREHPEQWETLRQHHHAILRSAMDNYHGYIFQVIGDAFCVAFSSARDALLASAQAQNSLYREYLEGSPIKVRMGIHTGRADLQDSGEYNGYITLSRVQGLMSAGHGGQILFSQSSQELVRDELPERVILQDLGEHRLKALIRPEHIYQVNISDLPTEFPPIKTLDSYNYNLPVQMTSFIGRETEIAEIRQAVTAHRLVTITGPGGVGKTRLALEAASASIKKFLNGGCWVDLASVINPSLIPVTIVKSLDTYMAPHQTPLEVIESYLISKQLVLVVDNCEHLISSCAELVEHLLNVCPKLHVLIVSREVLGIYGEVIWHVPSLPFPDPQSLPSIQNLLEYPSVRLFLERAAAVSPGYSLSELNCRPIAQICQKLDGLPLAIELAAARITLLSAKEIAARLVDRFDLLTGGSRNALPRQQTLRATLDWSYELLTEPEQSLFRCLSVFADYFSLEAAEQIARSNLPLSDRSNFFNLLVQLVNKSLINAVTELPGSESGSRYVMLETIREYAREKLVTAGETIPVHKCFLDYYLRLVKEAEPKLYNQEQDAWSDRIEAEYDNLRAAIEWSLKNKDTEQGAQLAIHLSRFWQLRGYSSEAAIWLNRILAEPEITDHTRAKLLITRAQIAEVQGEYEQAIGYVEAGLAILKAYGDLSGITRGNVIMGIITIFQGERKKGIQLLEECLKTLRESGDEWQAAVVLLYVSDSYNRMGDNTRAALLCQESLSLFNKLGDSWGIAFASGITGEIARQQGNLQKAKEYFRKDLVYHWQHGQKGEIPYPLETLSLIAINEKEYLRAARLWGAAQVYREKANAPLPPAYQNDYHKYLALAHENLGEKAFDSAINQGRELPPQAVFDLATHDNLTPLETLSSIGTEPILEVRLTRREAEILRLVANGMTDSQVAQQLFLSPRTIGKHLESIYSKLHVNSRTAATHFALKHQLIEQ